MNCRVCHSPDYYEGISGPNCINPLCAHFKNGKLTQVQLKTDEIVTVGNPQYMAFMTAEVESNGSDIYINESLPNQKGVLWYWYDNNQVTLEIRPVKFKNKTKATEIIPWNVDPILACDLEKIVNRYGGECIQNLVYYINDVSEREGRHIASKIYETLYQKALTLK